MKKTLRRAALFFMLTAALAAPAASAAGPDAAALAAAASAAEKMYYCGELYVFSDSMRKINYEIAAVCAKLQEDMSDKGLDTPEKRLAALDSLIERYNAAAGAYNEWIAAKDALLSGVSNKLKDKDVFDRSNLLYAYTATLGAVRSAKTVLENARAHIEQPGGRSANAVLSGANSVISKVSSIDKTLEKHAESCLAGYRKYFGEFASSAEVQPLSGVPS